MTGQPFDTLEPAPSSVGLSQGCAEGADSNVDEVAWKQRLHEIDPFPTRKFSSPNECHARMATGGVVCGEPVSQDQRWGLDHTPLCPRHFARLAHDALLDFSNFTDAPCRPSHITSAPDDPVWSVKDAMEIIVSLEDALVRWGLRFLPRPKRHHAPSRRPRRKRLGISSRTRFAVFERDGFCCHYCGRSAPHVELHVDHIIPVSRGGSDEMDNYIASCADCNLGKHTKLIFDEVAA